MISKVALSVAFATACLAATQADTFAASDSPRIQAAYQLGKDDAKKQLARLIRQSAPERLASVV
ncbi:hypothetical protein HU675_0050565 (plasmid) [Bradyrhizobium septentrionale]|uniref:hypothetical protein n=1 Tax=Bradyrhizobium septentrionale TaxID=1404411 RepID=UPI0015965A2D|nr:hypothetical protein [Bradyrhizobium septentrionale]UGY30459.1 hypothetical protein HU675_0050565 [Bradyrhizobium septentrionale]